MVLMLYIWGDGKLSYTGIDGINVVHGGMGSCHTQE